MERESMLESTTTPQPDPTSSESGQATSSGGYIIFYITLGVIFVVFVLAMLTGTFISRRNQGRDGIQQATQPPSRQIQTRGIARIVIESIPIFRFGEDNVMGAGQRDIELATTKQRNDDPQSTTTILATSSSISPKQITADCDRGADILVTAEGSLSSAQLPPLQTQSRSLECPICVDGFVQGEEIRMLPCTHRFHLGCIDPWLLNASGTCPVW